MLRNALVKGSQKTQTKAKPGKMVGVKTNTKKAAASDGNTSSDDDSGSDFEVESSFNTTPSSNLNANNVKGTPSNKKNLNSSIGNTPGKKLTKGAAQNGGGGSDSSDDSEEESTPNTFFIDKKANGTAAKKSKAVQGAPKQSPKKSQLAPTSAQNKAKKGQGQSDSDDDSDSDSDDKPTTAKKPSNSAAVGKAAPKGINDQDEESSDDDDDDMEVDDKPKQQKSSGNLKAQNATPNQAGNKRKRDSTSDQDNPPAKFGALGTPPAEDNPKRKHKVTAIKELSNYNLARYQELPSQEGDVKLEIRKAMERRIRRQALQGLVLEGHIGGINKEEILKLVETDIQAVKWKHTIDSAVFYFKSHDEAKSAMEKLGSLKLGGMGVSVKDEFPGDPQETVKVFSNFCKIKMPEMKQTFPTSNTVTQKKEYYIKEYTATFQQKQQAQKAVEKAFNTRVNGCLVFPHYISIEDLNQSSNNELIETPVQAKKQKQDEEVEEASSDDDDEEDEGEDDSDDNDDTKDGAGGEQDDDDSDDSDESD